MFSVICHGSAKSHLPGEVCDKSLAGAGMKVAARFLVFSQYRLCLMCHRAIQPTMYLKQIFG